MSGGGRLHLAGDHPGLCGGHRWLVGNRRSTLEGREAVDRVSHDGLQDVQLSRVFSFQEVELGDGEVVGMEARGAPEARAAGRRALGIDILRWLEKSVDQIS